MVKTSHIKLGLCYVKSNSRGISHEIDIMQNLAIACPHSIAHTTCGASEYTEEIIVKLVTVTSKQQLSAAIQLSRASYTASSS